MQLSILPSKWCVRDGSVDDGLLPDLCYYPINHAGHRLLEKAKKNPEITVDVKVLRPFACKIKRFGFSTYAEGLQQLKTMQSTSDTEDYEDEKPFAKRKTAAEMFAAIQAQDKPMDSASSSVVLQAVPQLPSAIPNYLTCDVFKTTMDGVLSELKTSREEYQEMKTLVCQLTAKVDYLASRSSTSAAPINSSIKLQESPFSPVENEDELILLEEKCRNPDYVKSAVQSLGKIMGHNRFIGNGGTVCLKMIDYVFSRQFLRKCSWTGTSRAQDDENAEPKVCFQKYEKSLDLFYQVVAYSDPKFPKNDALLFVHRCLKNSKQRLADKGERNAVSRKRRKQHDGYVSCEDEAADEAGSAGGQEMGETSPSAGGQELGESSQSANTTVEVLEEYLLATL